MYLVEAPFLFIGIASLFFKKGREKKLVAYWLFIGPIAASITKDAPHTNRMFAIFPALPLVTAIGFLQVKEWIFLHQRHLKNILISIICFALLFNIAIYLDRYYVHFPKNEAQNWGIGYKQLHVILSEKRFASKNIIMTRPNYSPYIFLLFYSVYDPLRYQETVRRYSPTEDGFVHVKSFDRYTFGEIDWKKDIKIPNTLLVASLLKIPDFVKKEYQTVDISLPNGETMFTIIETK